MPQIKPFLKSKTPVLNWIKIQKLPLFFKFYHRTNFSHKENTFPTSASHGSRSTSAALRPILAQWPQRPRSSSGPLRAGNARGALRSDGAGEPGRAGRPLLPCSPASSLRPCRPCSSSWPSGSDWACLSLWAALSDGTRTPGGAWGSCKSILFLFT